MSVPTAAENGELKLDTDGIQKLASLYHAVDHPTRLSIMKLIHCNEAMSVMEISIKMRLDKEAVSQQLGILRRAEVVYSRPRSRFRYYSLNYKLLDHLKFGFDP
jgi:DNA-binding transcriptional ArsR family regulator